MIFIEPIIINDLTFAYPGQKPLFNHCDLNLSSDWKLGLLGQVERELNLMATDPALLWQPVKTLSGGEQTRIMLATLFAQNDLFPLLDEPTNHLDQQGRKLIAQYLKQKQTGFIITSHDQHFLDQIATKQINI